jgi:hypothetical protein
LASINSALENWRAWGQGEEKKYLRNKRLPRGCGVPPLNLHKKQQEILPCNEAESQRNLNRWLWRSFRTTAQKEVWVAIVRAMRPDWFAAETWPLPVQFCRHVTNASVIAKALDATNIGTDLACFARLAGLQAQETSAIISLSTKMRLTHQASRDSRHVKRDPGAGRPKPWETGGD